MIEAGPERKKYLLHKGFLTHYSKYFRNALRGPWKEADERVIPLPDIEPGILNIFVDWLYTQVLPDDAALPSVAEIAEETPSYETISLLLVKAVAFGDRFMVPKFYEEVSSRSISRLQATRPDFATIIFAFGNLPGDASLLEQLVEAHCRLWCPKCPHDEPNVEKDLKAQLPKDFLIRVMDKYGQMVSSMPTAISRVPVANTNQRIAHLESLSSDSASDSASDADSGSDSSSDLGSSDSDSDGNEAV